MKSISIIIPMFNSSKFLKELFDCFDNCKFELNDEIIIVDNGSTDGSFEICNKFAERDNERYKIVSFTAKADSYAARNYGAKFAHGDILAFTDSDCKPTPEWLETIRTSLQMGEVLAGDIQLEVLSNGIWELYDSVAHLSQCKNNANKNCVATANMAVHKIDFEKVGLFEERFSGGDFDWSQRANSKGMRIVFHPEALAFHPSRKTYLEIKKREERVAYGRGVHHRTNGKSYITLIVAYFLRVFKLSTQINYSKQMKRRGATIKQLIIFNFGFLAIRFYYIVYASRGYKGIDPRKYNVK